MPIKRKKTKVINIGSIAIGGENPIAIQSMTNTETANVEQTVAQIRELESAGCEIIRLAVNNADAANAIKDIKQKVKMPIVADIHFDYRLALSAIENGVDKLRINPGNIGSPDKVALIVEAAKRMNIPIRIGVNAGSLEKEILEKYNGVTDEGLFESAMNHVRILEALNFEDIVISIKASSVSLSLDAFKRISDSVDYPLHIGITESGTLYNGSIKSAVGIGALLSHGIGDTLRVSLTSDPVEEIRCARQILKSMGLRKFGAELISCPTCGRTQINLIELAKKVEMEIEKIDKPITVAVMGCPVNGPGEAKEADIGIAAGKGFGIIFKKGEIIKRVAESELLEELMIQIKSLM